jgi:hypothetical protein
MPKTQAKRGMSPRELDALRRQFVAEQKQADSASKWQLANDIVSGINDIVGRGVIAPILGMPGDINQAIYDAGAFVNNKIKDVEVATGMVKQPRYVQPTQGNAYLGSEDIGSRMQQAGLVSSERRPKTELAASLISPGAAAKTAINAPKTAMNALRMADNLEAPSRGIRNADGMYIPRSQMGAIDVWHGSPHKFEQFRAMDNIGGGEGAQAYGHGGYHAASPDVAQRYATQLAFDRPKAIKSRADEVLDDLNYHRGNIDGVRASYQGMIDSGIPETVAYANEKMALLDDVVSKERKSNLYRNQLRWPDPAREASDPLSDKHFLDWDKPLSEQSASVQSALRGINPDELNWLKGAIKGTAKGSEIYDSARLDFASSPIDDTGTSQRLNQAGIPGIRYLDAGSRPTNVVDKELYALYEKYGDVEKAVDEMMKGVYNTPKVKQQMREGYIKQLNEQKQTHNYVTFSDDLVNILERNGVPVTAPQPGLSNQIDVWHGTDLEFNTPNTPLFLGDRDIAEAYAKQRSLESGNNPVLMGGKANFKKIATDADVLAVADELGLQAENDMAFSLLDPSIAGKVKSKKVIDALRAKGFDSAKISDFSPDDPFTLRSSYVAFDPQQLNIKKVTEPSPKK